jgi:hypothetical protein
MNENRCVQAHRVDPDRPRRAVDGLYLCHGHLQHLEQLIAELPAHHDGLQRARGAAGPRPPGSHSELPVDDAIAAHRGRMTAVLASWCRVVAEDRGVRPPDSPDIHRVAAWLLGPRMRHVEWIAANRWVDEMAGELREVTRTARALTDIRAKHVPIGVQCFVNRDGQRCPGIVTLIVRADEWRVRCPEPECTDVQDDVTPYLRAIRKGVGVTEEDVHVMAARYGIAVSDDVLRQWRHRKRIAFKVVGGVFWYDLASVADYLSRRAARERIAS